MTKYPIPRVSMTARLIRGLWPDHNPLRRATDRAAAAVVAGLLAAFVVGTPVATVAAARWAYAAGLRAEQAERTTWREVRAMLLQDTPGPIGTPYEILVPRVLARWSAPNGATQIGLVSVDHASRAGSTVVIWTDASGRPADRAPLNSGQVAQQAALVATAAPVALAAVLLIVGTLAWQGLNKRRLAAWDADWQVTGPLWTSRK